MIFIDTSAFRAKFDQGDRHRRAALPVWRALKRDGEALLTTNYVIVETVTFLTRSCGPASAAEFASRLLAGGTEVTLVRLSPDDEFRAARILEELGRRDVSFTDATSFAIMRRRGIATAFTFDGDFAAAGFKTIP